jgi:plasmid stabilization system protein ParE
LEIELTAQAEADLVEIGDFIAKDNPSAAERYVRRLRDRIAAIARISRSGTSYSKKIQIEIAPNIVRDNPPTSDRFALAR